MLLLMNNFSAKASQKHGVISLMFQTRADVPNTDFFPTQSINNQALPAAGFASFFFHILLGSAGDATLSL